MLINIELQEIAYYVKFFLVGLLSFLFALLGTSTRKIFIPVKKLNSVGVLGYIIGCVFVCLLILLLGTIYLIAPKIPYAIEQILIAELIGGFLFWEIMNFLTMLQISKILKINLDAFQTKADLKNKKGENSDESISKRH